MKRIISLLIVMSILLSFSACGDKTPESNPSTIPEQSSSVPSERPSEESNETIPEETTKPTNPTDETVTDKKPQKVPTVAEIMGSVIKKLSKSDYITLKTASDENEMQLKYITATGEYFGVETWEYKDLKHINEYYVIKEDDGYLSYEVNKTYNSSNELQNTNIFAYRGCQDLLIDLLFLDSLEVYLDLNKETEIINDVECYVLEYSTDIQGYDESVGAISVYVDKTNYQLVKITIRDESTDIDVNFSYDKFVIEIPDDVKNNAKESYRSYSNEPNIFLPSYKNKVNDICNIVVDDIKITMGERATFVNIEKNNFTIDAGEQYLLDGLELIGPIASEGMIQPNGIVTYEISYNNGSRHSWTVTVQNQTLIEKKPSECIVISITDEYPSGNGEDLCFQDVKSMYGDKYHRTFVEDGVLISWRQGDVTIYTAVGIGAIEAICVMPNSLFDMMVDTMFES